jgi:hypothetical protein
LTVKRIVPVLAAAVLLAGAGVATASAVTASGTVYIGNCTTEGDFVSCSVQGDISHPSSISVQVWASPAQQIDVAWGDDCFSASGGTSGSRNGSFTVTAGASSRVTRRIPLTAGHGGSCTPNVFVSPEGTGRIHVVLTGRN